MPKLSPQFLGKPLIPRTGDWGAAAHRRKRAMALNDPKLRVNAKSTSMVQQAVMDPLSGDRGSEVRIGVAHVADADHDLTPSPW